MLQKIPFQLAAKTLLVVCACVIVFHLLIVGGVIPYSIVWGGRLTNSAEMLRFESISISINLLIMLVTAMHVGFIPKYIPQKALTVILWGLFMLLCGNTVANVFSVTTFEKVVFTPLTFVLALCIFRLLESKQQVQLA